MASPSVDAAEKLQLALHLFSKALPTDEQAPSSFLAGRARRGAWLGPGF